MQSNQLENYPSFDEIESIDEAVLKLDHLLEREKDQTSIPRETEFWGCYSNMQVLL